MYKNKHRRGIHLLLLVSLVISFSCGGSGSVNDPPINIEPFILQARNEQCSDIRNKLYLIDNSSVFWDRAGNCPDNSFSQTLYGHTVDQVLCSHFDSIAGPRTIYYDETHKDLCDTLFANPGKPDLGLGTGHTVLPVNVETACTTNAGCLSTEYCSKALGDCEGQGVCIEMPRVCPLAPVSIGDLVCGCDGRTYGSNINACDAAMLGVNIAHQGACP
ncbi:MAG: hypothetical protein ACYC69_12540 [Thermodesulfovibrionales bacterium]